MNTELPKSTEKPKEISIQVVDLESASKDTYTVVIPEREGSTKLYVYPTAGTGFGFKIVKDPKNNEWTIAERNLSLAFMKEKEAEGEHVYNARKVPSPQRSNG